MEAQRNRVLEGMQEWKDKERQIADLFSPATIQTVYFQKLKLDHLYELSRSVADPSKEEKILLRILDGEIKQLERQMYPNVMERFFVQLARAIKDFFRNREKPDFGPQTNWKLKVDVTGQRKENKIKIANTAAPKLNLRKNAQPSLLEKKGTRHKNGLGR